MEKALGDKLCGLTEGIHKLEAHLCGYDGGAVGLRDGEAPVVAAAVISTPPAASALIPALTGVYAQYSVQGKHWYAPNLFEAYGEAEIQGVVLAHVKKSQFLLL